MFQKGYPTYTSLGSLLVLPESLLRRHMDGFTWLKSEGKGTEDSPQLLY